MRDPRRRGQNGKEEGMLRTGPWNFHSNGFYQTQSGNMHLLVEKVGSGFRVLVTDAAEGMDAERLVYAGSARDADAAMRLAEREAERLVG
jgi:hypothetical protein